MWSCMGLVARGQAAGESGTAIKSFQDCLIAEKDPYLRWRAEAWLKSLQRGN